MSIYFRGSHFHFVEMLEYLREHDMCDAETIDDEIYLARRPRSWVLSTTDISYIIDVLKLDKTIITMLALQFPIFFEQE